MVAYRFYMHTTIIRLFCLKIIIGALCITYIAETQSGWFSHYKHKQEELLELTPKKGHCSLFIEHELPGSVDIKGWHQNHIAVTIHKKAYTADDAAQLLCTLTQTDQGVVTLHTAASGEHHKHGVMNITVHIPQQTATNISAQADVFIMHTHNTIRVKTEEGAIIAHATNGSLNLETKKGDIEITNTHGSVFAYTEHGTITIKKSYANIDAETARGSISLSCAAIPSTAQIELETGKRGTIKLAVPETTEARISADTTRGTITSDVLITLERHTTLLNSGAYKDAQRHIRGIIGQQGTAEIRLIGSSDIHITPSESTE